MATFITIISLPIFFFFLLPTPETCSTNQTDLLSLLAIKSSLQDPQGALRSWNQTLHFCTWEGIQCGSNHKDRVVAINLISQGLTGTLSPHVGNLSFLTTIVLQNNTFQGPIPPQLSLLHRLKVVDFTMNAFDGSIPTNLSQSLNLEQLVFTKNFLSGTIPKELGLLSKLGDLSLSVNKLSGSIPSSIGNITTLWRFSAASCNLTGEIPDSLGGLSSLEFIQLSKNELTGTIPSALFNISSLFYFDVTDNHLHGVIPSSIGLTSPNLACLVLRHNNFSGQIPSSISNASIIEWIMLSSNHFTGPVPNLQTLPLIQNLYLSSNLIIDDMSFISSLTNSTKLERLNVSDNMLSGSLPGSIANLSSLIVYMNMNKNRIHGRVPLGIGNLINLTVLDLSDNLLDGQLPLDISKLSNLQTLLLGKNTFEGELPPLVGNMTLLSRLRIDGNKLSGNLPATLGSFTNLLELDLSHNNFIGSIPPEIMRLPSLSIALNLSYNAFVGSVPYEVGSLTKVAALDLSSNRLSGLIPNTISSCASLEKLYLNNNLLEGEVPSGLNALMGLQDLDLSQNNLSGAIPDFLGRMKLQRLNLSFNRLDGEIPTGGAFENATSISLGGNQGLCGGISELKLPSCPAVESAKRKNSTLLKILIPVLVIGGLCIFLLVLFTCKRKVSAEDKISSMPPHDNIGNQFVRLSYADLLKATSGFSESNKVGFGRFGSVFKGILNQGNTLVAVKVLNLAVRGASKTFLSECRTLRGVKHRNLVKLLSVCDSMDFQGKNFKALVYEFKVNGSLEKWLYSSKEQGEEFKNLSIIQRLNIAIDIARGIQYLHFGTGSSIVHGDLKPSNILLDQEMVACVGDFGLAKIVSSILQSRESNSSIGIKGTLGYVPPEYGTFDAVSTQGDVYSFGIILLEMFTNKRPTDDLFDDHQNLHNFVSNALPDRVIEILDPQLQAEAKADFDMKKLKDCLLCILSIGVSCSKEIAKDRVSITNAFNELSGIKSYFLAENL